MSAGILLSQKNKPKSKKFGKKGQALVEYMIIISLVSLSAVAVLKTFGTSLKSHIKASTSSLLSVTKKVKKDGADADSVSDEGF